ncbi:MAG: magnesium transporter [Pseudohongiellaceae bacterium]
MNYDTLSETLHAAIEQGNSDSIKAILDEFQAADVAEFVRHEDAETTLRLISYLPLEDRAQTIGYLDFSDQLEIANSLDESSLARLFMHMHADERADLFNVLDQKRQESILRRLARDEREDLRKLASYEEGTAGAIMTSEYAVLPVECSVEQALAHLRATAPDAETIYQVYLLDERHRIAGTVSLRELILAHSATPVSKLMQSDVVALTVDTPQEEVARLISRYDLLALPIIDSGERMVGIVTYDDAMDVAEAEATEDIHKGATIGKMTESLRGASLITLYRKRAGWLVLLVFGQLFSGMGIAYYEETISTYIALVFFLPLLVGSSGNAGSQAATLMVRGLATGDVRLSDWGRLLGKEVLVATALGLTMAFAVSFLAMYRGGYEIALVVSMSMIAVVIAGSLIGMSLPFVLNRLNLDPATASAPLVASIADATGVLVYFSIATAILGLPAIN